MADHLARLYEQVFPDSKIAKNFCCSQTKATNILNKAMAPLLHSALVHHMAENPFSIVNDCSNDCGLSKVNPVCVYIFDF